MRIAARRLLCLHPKGKTTQRTKLMTIQYPVVYKYIARQIAATTGCLACVAGGIQRARGTFLARRHHAKWVAMPREKIFKLTCIPWLVQSIKTDIGKPFDKSITIDNSNLNVIDFIDQSIEIDTHNHRCSFKVLNLSILSFSLRTVHCWHL